MDYLMRFLSIEPVALNLKEKLIAALACFSSILLNGWLTHTYAPQHAVPLVASMGASAVILFAVPTSPLAQPWPLVGGQLLSAAVGVFCAYYIHDLTLAAATAVGLSVLLMLVGRCLHPPGAATALAPILSASPKSELDLEFLFLPVGVNVLWMLIFVLLINRLLLRRDYPLSPKSKALKRTQRKHRLLGVGEGDLEQVTRDIGHFLDIGNEELLQIFTRLQLLNFQKQRQNLTCQDIMQRNIVTAEYSTEVEDAWTLMHERRLTVLPVLDRTQRVIGIVTRYDFLKQLKLTTYRSFQEKWLAFIKTTPDVSTHKPEAIGHIMTRQVKTLPADAPIAALFPLAVEEGHHHVPIVDQDGRFVGLVFQADLLAAIFQNGLQSG